MKKQLHRIYFARKILLVSLLFFVAMILSQKSFAVYCYFNGFNGYSPTSETVCSGNQTSITATWSVVSACIGGGLSYSTYTINWYYNTTNSTTVAGATLVQTTPGIKCNITSSDVLLASNIVVPPYGSTYYYFAVATVTSGCSATNGTTTVPVTQPIVAITTQPTDQNACAGSNTSFSIAAAGCSLSYQWQVSTDGGFTWSNITTAGSNPTYSTWTTSTLNLSGVVAGNNGYKYRCIASGGASVTSTVATLSIVATPSITNQPANAAECQGSSAILSGLVASPASSTFQWQYWNGAIWANVVNGTPANFTYSNQTTANLTVATTTAAAAGTYTYRCNVTACASTVSSSSAVLTVNAIPLAGSVSASPSTGTINCSTGAGISTTITLAGGYTGTIQWQESSDNATWFDIQGATSNTYTTTVSSTTYFHTTQTLSNGCTATQATSAVVTITNSTVNNYIGASGGSWSVAGNWSAGVPTICQDVTIPAAITVIADLATANANCHNLTVASGGQITLNRQNGRFLSVYGHLINNSNGNGNSNGGIQQNTASSSSGQGNSSGLQLMGTGTVWGGTNNTLYPLVTLRVGDGSDVTMTADATIDMIDATNTATPGNLSLASKTLKITHSFFNTGSSVHVNTGYLWLQLTASMSINQTALFPDYGTVFDDLAGNWIISGSWNSIGGTGWYNLEIRNSTSGSKAEYASSHVCRGYLKIWPGAGTVRFGACDFCCGGCNGVAPPPYTVTVAGDFTNDGTTDITTDATFIMNGTAAQSMNGSTVTKFSYLQINNTSSTGVTLNQKEEVGVAASPYGGLTLTSGYLYTSSTNLLTVNANATSTSGSAASFVAGPMRKIGNNAFVFPVGNIVGATPWWRRVGISAPSLATDQFDAQYLHTGYGTYPLCTVPTNTLVSVSNTEYWTLDRTAGTSKPTVTLYWEDAAASLLNPVPIADVRVGHYDISGSLCWQNYNDAATTQTGATSGTSAGTVSASAVASIANPFSPFTISSVIVPLPIELLSFTAECSTSSPNLSPNAEGNKVIARWETASEQNNNFFTLEKSLDGINFYSVATVDGANNSNTIKKYSAIDAEPCKTTCYYRLRQTDYNGQSQTFNIVAVDGCGNKGGFSVYPNPASGKFNVSVSGTQGTQVLIVVRDLLGQEFYSQVLLLSNDAETFAIDPSGKLAAGVYFVMATSDDTIYKKKLVIK